MLTMIATEPLYLQIHIIAALMAVVTGPVALYRKRRDRVHKVTGYIWITTMLTVATSSWWISSFAVIGPFSPIHGFALLTYWSVFTGMRAIFARRIKEHQTILRSLYWNGLLIAGLANFLPGRRMNEAIFGADSSLGWVVMTLGGAALIWRNLRGVTWARREVA